MQDNPAGPDKTAVPFGSHNNPTPPFVTQFPTHPIMQYMGVTDQAHMGGSEQVFLPYKPGGGWRPTTFVAVYDPSQADIPLKSDGAAAVVTFGRGFGEPDRGYIVTEGGHDVGGTSTDNIAAQRIFLNSSFVFVLDKQANVSVKKYAFGNVFRNHLHWFKGSCNIYYSWRYLYV